MWIILILLFAGTLLGFMLNRFKKFNRFTDKASMYIIYILLFFMGLSVGTKPEIMKNLTGIGIEALIIALFAIAGSVFTAFIVYRFMRRNNEK
jgi:uncharacterized membrane protein YbjE (DUF340 family)